MRNRTECFLIWAKDVKEGQFIVNVGTVQKDPEPFGVFVLVTVVENVWDLATGRCHENWRTLLMHSSDTVTVEG